MQNQLLVSLLYCCNENNVPVSVLNSLMVLQEAYMLMRNLELQTVSQFRQIGPRQICHVVSNDIKL